jgi:uncharacterized 2Fe-2S/4Fe-4S cluster protein (DUF4445 family)
MPTITLKPTNAEVRADAGTPLRDLLFEQGVEFPCGGKGRCRGCKVRVLSGEAGVNQAQRDHLSEAELDQGWRLACQCELEGDLVLELRQWDAAILADDAAFNFSPREGLGVAVDLGTTTLVAQLLDLQTSHVLAVRTALNPQARFGADVMSRVTYAVQEAGQAQLQKIIRDQIGKLIRDLVFAAQVDAARIIDVTIVGNTVMHHLFCGIDLEPMSHYPFEPLYDGLKVFNAEELGWHLASHATVRFLPCLGGFVGSDILAGVLATRLHESDELMGLVDLGTNGEIVIGNKHGLLTASTAAGPAFEGARIGMGMRAASGAISEVSANGEGVTCHVIGNIAPAGICGSGLVDAIAAGLDLEVIAPSGRLLEGSAGIYRTDELKWMLIEPVSIGQTDVRQLQLAKGAIAAGVSILLKQWLAEHAADSPTPNPSPAHGGGEMKRLYLAGAFGNYINRASAQRIGLIKFPPEQVQPSGNTALLGAKLALFEPEADYTAIVKMTRHVSLNEDPEFMDAYVEEMTFPEET